MYEIQYAQNYFREIATQSNKSNQQVTKIATLIKINQINSFAIKVQHV